MILPEFFALVVKLTLQNCRWRQDRHNIWRGVESIRIETTFLRRTQSIIQEARSGRMMADDLYI
jgi:hypothetical protein